MTSKLIRAGVAAGALLALPLAVQAADFARPSYKAPAYGGPFGYNWSGLYLGINGGYGFGHSNWTDVTGATTGDFSVSGGLVGGTLGYNLQTGTWVWGVEGDIGASWIKGTDTAACGIPGCETKNDWFGTARGRIGYGGFNGWMPYITGGAAFGDIKASTGFGSQTSTKLGWTVGGGLEIALWDSWSTKLEYLYADLGKGTCSGVVCSPAIDVDFRAHIVRLGLNYRF
jgi:outer membrane immunogenic protein